MGWWLAYLVVLVLVCRWWYLWGIAEGRLLERIERAERWHGDGPGAA